MFLRPDSSRLAARLAIVFFLFQRNASSGNSADKAKKLKDGPTDFSRIRCPLCRWQPRATSRWYCADDAFHLGCYTAWNTFDTGGRCPGCAYLWKWTECLRCGKSSLHEAWYEDKANQP